MTRSSRHREKLGNGSELSGASAFEGSAARTRPLSLEEIMTRRKNKKLTADATEGADPVDLPRQDIAKSVSDHPEHDERSTHGKEYSYVISKKETEDTMKRRSRKEETTSLKEQNSVIVGDKESHDSETKLKDKLDNEFGRVKEQRSEKQSHHRSRYEEHHGNHNKSGGVTDRKSEKQSHHRSSNEKHSKNENQSHHRSSNEKHSKNENQSRHRTRDEERKNENQSHHRSRDEERKNANQSHRKTRDEERPRSDNKTGGVTERKSEKQSHHRSSNEKRSRDDNETRKNHAEKLGGKEMYLDGERMKSERESKRKHRGIEDGRDTLEIESVVKKHDSGKYNPEPAERKDRKKDTSKSHYEGSGQKRRRSSSRDFRARDRSNSLSPRAPKRTYDGREHGESSLHVSKDGRHHFDVDKNRVSNNGGHTSSQSWRNGGRGSRLGGYSPRKRRSEAAIKTPSPTARSPERKNAGWDFPPIGSDSFGVISDFQSLHQSVSTEREFSNVVSVTPNAMETLVVVSPSSVSKAKDVTVGTMQLSQPTRSLRTLYVENLPDPVSDKSIMECLNNYLLSLGDYIQGTQPCISCHMNKAKDQALVEFLTPEDATKALSFNGRFFSGSVLKIRRPEDFVDAATGVPENSVPAVDAVSDIVRDSPHKIFVGGISKALSSKMLMEIASSFGHLKAYRFEVNADLKEPCAFLEYKDQTITLKACAGLNGMKLGGQVLTVVQAVPNASVEVNADHLPFYGIPEHAKPLLSKPTKVLKLKNIFNPEDLSSLSRSEIEEALEDIRIECARFGTVKSINIVRCESSCAIADQTDEVTLQDLEGDSFTTQDIDQASGENRSEEAYINVKEPLEDGGDMKDVRPTHDIPEEGMEKTEMSEECRPDSSLATDVFMCNPVAEANPQEAPSQEESGDELNHDDDTGMNKSIMVEPQLKHVETKDGLQEASLQLNHTVSEESQISEKNEIKQEKPDDEAFERGCVLVEYVRSEASCLAAHCLHGRLYGDRTVLVNYIPHDLYLSKFPK
ncbi:hypothetical protein AQUCO_01700781v1 [Aquilegia coerulea]|uniref:RRM domain-containing protein n=1 Tax=Aquilegia coerulea TaxID=218851 RepID=A0A2G5DQF8_AQUCA|nr:hypothetical protein AQUCO_01700781v1 [Aquilegia coerulea]